MMNPSHPSDDDLVFQISSANYSLPFQTTPEDQILHDPLITIQMGKGKHRKQLPAWEKEDYKVTIDEDKKCMRRETERKRRQEMARLCATLRSLLPYEYIKGKRSTSDHMHEGTNYIKCLQNRVKQLQAKRDELMRLSNSRPAGPQSGTFTTHLPTNVNVRPFPGGVEIMWSYSISKCVFPLSRVLDMLLKQGLNVIFCTSTKTDDRFIHTIRSEDPNMMTGTDYSELQRKLTEAISSSSLSEPEKLLIS